MFCYSAVHQGRRRHRHPHPNHRRDDGGGQGIGDGLRVAQLLYGTRFVCVFVESGWAAFASTLLFDIDTVMALPLVFMSLGVG